MKTLTLSPDLLFIYLFIYFFFYLFFFIFSGNQMQYLSHNLCIFWLVIRCNVLGVTSGTECSGMIISQDLETGVF